MRIGGELRETEHVEPISSPYDGELVGEVFVGDDGDMDDAIAAAAAAFEQTRRMPTHRRIEILRGTAAGIEARADELATLMTRESGKPLRFSRGEVARAVVTFQLGAAEATRPSGEVLPVDLEARSEGRLCLHTRVPRGPVAAISPFNFPLNLIAHKLSPAVAIGASVVLKPPPQCPLTGFALAEILAAAGLPEGALNVLHCPAADR
jgi:acyl-CoA reductase-like NAD-dependent aldehyde dehydrogenase